MYVQEHKSISPLSQSFPALTLHWRHSQTDATLLQLSYYCHMFEHSWLVVECLNQLEGLLSLRAIEKLHLIG